MTSQDRKETTRATRNKTYATQYAVPASIRALLEISLARRENAPARSCLHVAPRDESGSAPRSWNI